MRIIVGGFICKRTIDKGEKGMKTLSYNTETGELFATYGFRKTSRESSDQNPKEESCEEDVTWVKAMAFS
jgi:hypothetical protein